MKLLLPLKYYDDAGRVKPAFALYLCIAFLTRSVLILIGSVSVRENGDQLLALFYPDRQYLYISLAIAMPAVLGLLLLGFRERIWHRNKCWLFSCIKPLLMVSVLADLALHLMSADSGHWRFSWIIASTLMVDALITYFLLKDKHTLVMLADWKNPTQLSAKSML